MSVVFLKRNQHLPNTNKLATPEQLIEDAKNGRMFILIDDEDRENEGDLIMPAEKAGADAINFMAKYGRGLICLAMTADRLRDLELPKMAQKNSTRHETAFTVSIEAREGVSTGISAADRATTVAVAIDPDKGVNDIATPGHVFPLEAREGGVLARSGHTEAAVDVARLAGLNPAGVICEVMNEDGTMARLPDLIKFAEHHGLNIGTIADLISYRLRNDRIVEKTLDTKLNSPYGGLFDMSVYINKIAFGEHIVLSKGDITTGEPVLVRMHSLNVLDDVLGDLSSDKSGELQRAMEMIDDEGRGVIVIIREPHPRNLSDVVQSRMGDTSVSKAHAPEPLRDYGVGAQILLDLGIHAMILLSNTQKNIVGLEGYGLSVIEQRPIPASV